MRVVALEEHFIIQPLYEKYFMQLGHDPALVGNLRDPARLAALSDVGAGRIREMDESGIDFQILGASIPGAESLPGTAGEDFSRELNDAVADVVAANPTRFAAFAHLPTRSPDAAADELERAVTQLGMKGAMINGLTDGRFLDHPSFGGLLDRAAALNVPIYLHPNRPPKSVVEAYYSDLPPRAAGILATAAFGWHIETALHVLRLAVAGTFDAHPGLNVIVGHLGEGLPFLLERANEQLSVTGALARPLAEIFQEHLYITTSAFVTLPPFLTTLLVFGIDRMMFSVDYPYSGNAEGRAFLDSLPISEADRRKLAHGNADRLFGLGATS